MTTDEIIQNIIYCGGSLIRNAASVAGDYERQTDLEILITIPVSKGIPVIKVNTAFLPEEAVGEFINIG